MSFIQFKTRTRTLLGTLLLLGISSAFLPQVSYSAVEIIKFDKPSKQVLYNKLIQELRCLVCQNQNLADSNAELAVDLRRKVRTMVAEGKTYADVVDYMVARYGEFVLYRPPFQLSTLFLWAAPILLLLIALCVFILKKRRESELTASPELINADAQKRIRSLLDESTSPDNKTVN